MLKDLFDGTCRIVPTKMDWTALDPPENADEKHFQGLFSYF